MFARGWLVLLTALVVVAAMAAGPALTTIEDRLYKADGTPFQGFLLIEWQSFVAQDSSNIATQQLAVPVVNGLVHTRLVANSTNSSYTVRYTSDGKIQFQEVWVVPQSTVTLRLKDVRAATTSGGSTVTPPQQQTQVLESDVAGLLADLATRPLRAATYAPSRAVYIDPTGALDAVVGNLTDCVRVDGTSGACGTGSSSSSGPGFIDGETPAGLVNGSNTVFTLANQPSPGTSLAIHRNGLLQLQGADYTLTGNAITFATASTPQASDLLVASYRLADPGNPTGQAGGALTGTYPNPSLALGVISDANVAALAGIREAKLALSYPTHSNSNDPTGGQKDALTGTAGTPSATNRYVTAQDSRLSDARAPLGHALLGNSHSDTTAGTPVRGDLVVAQGSSQAAWTRLPVGPANRCLMSNGFDAVWNTCLYTGFTAGAVPFVDASGNLAQNSTLLAWDNTNRKLSVGNSNGGATLYVWDLQASTGLTTLVVRAGQGQATSPLARWTDASATDLARVESDGRVVAASVRSSTTAGRAAWQDSGDSTDPSSRPDGDAWYNSTALSHKTAEGGQTHTVPEVLCSSTGVNTTSTGLVQLGSCTVPANLLKPGDRVEVRFDYTHEGSATGFTFEVRWGGTVVISRSAAASETAVTGRANAGVHTSGSQYGVESWGSALAAAFAAGTAPDSLAGAIVVSFLGKMAGTTTDTVTLRNFTVVRYPGQQNP